MILEVEATELLEANGWIKKEEHGLEFKKVIEGDRFYARVENNKVYFLIFGETGVRAIANTTLELIKALEIIK